ncbi:MAG: hypothetical protein ACXWZS_08210 [Gemmatirosa sp.]
MGPSRTIAAVCLTGGIALLAAPLDAQTPTATPVAHETPADTVEIPMKLRGFYERRADKRGYYFDRAALDASTGKRLSEVIRDLPGVRLVPSPNSAVSAVRFRNCQPLIWVDAVRNVGDELDAAIAVGDVAAMEVYVSPGGVPAQFRDMRQPCGAVIVWTR